MCFVRLLALLGPWSVLPGGRPGSISPPARAGGRKWCRQRRLVVTKRGASMILILGAPGESCSRGAPGEEPHPL